MAIQSVPIVPVAGPAYRRDYRDSGETLLPMMLALIQMFQSEQESKREHGISERLASIQEKQSGLQEKLGNLQIENLRREQLSSRLQSVSETAQLDQQALGEEKARSFSRNVRDDVRTGERVFNENFRDLVTGIRRGSTGSNREKLLSSLQSTSSRLEDVAKSLTNQSQRAGFVARLGQVLNDAAALPLDSAQMEQITMLADMSLPARTAMPTAEQLPAYVATSEQTYRTRRAEQVSAVGNRARRKVLGLLDQYEPDSPVLEREARKLINAEYETITDPVMGDVLQPLFDSRFRRAVEPEHQHIGQQLIGAGQAVGRSVGEGITGVPGFNLFDTLNIMTPFAGMGAMFGTRFPAQNVDPQQPQVVRQGSPVPPPVTTNFMRMQQNQEMAGFMDVLNNLNPAPPPIDPLTLLLGR